VGAPEGIGLYAVDPDEQELSSQWLDQDAGGAVEDRYTPEQQDGHGPDRPREHASPPPWGNYWSMTHFTWILARAP
jgi:hypothetical protein